MTYLGPFISHTDPPGYPKARILNHPTDVAVDPDGDIYDADWGNHRLCIFDAEGTPLTHLEHVPPQLNQGDSRGAEDGRGYRH